MVCEARKLGWKRIAQNVHSFDYRWDSPFNFALAIILGAILGIVTHKPHWNWGLSSTIIGAAYNLDCNSL